MCFAWWPGLDFGVDTWGSVGVGVRGVFGFNGKVLVLLDGFEVNETLYASVSFGNHFQVDQIDRVEVIRGPGSAQYGGFAELAVINIITHAGGDATGYRADVTYGVLDEGVYGRRGVGVSGAELLGSTRLGVSAWGKQGRRSAESFTDVWGDSYDMTSSSNLSDYGASVHLAAERLELRIASEYYQNEHRDGYDAVKPLTQESDFGSVWASAAYAVPLGTRATLTPSLSYKRQWSWWSTMNLEPTDWDYYDPQTDRAVARLHLDAPAGDALHIVAGAEGTYDRVTGGPGIEASDWYGPDNQNNYQNIATYAESILQVPDRPVLTLGGRFEAHSLYGPSFVPRAAVTQAWDRVHYKALVSRAFRTPAMEEMNSSPDVEPERTASYGVEVGAKVTDSVYLTVTGFRAVIEDFLHYYYLYDEETDEEFRGLHQRRTASVAAASRPCCATTRAVHGRRSAGPGTRHAGSASPRATRCQA